MLIALWLSPRAFAESGCFSANFGAVGLPFDSGIATFATGTAPYRYSVTGTLPGGLALNSATGEITGTPTSTGSFSVGVADAYGSAGSSCSITVGALSSPSATLGVSNAYNLIALSGGISNTADILGRIAAAGSIDKATTVGTALRTADPFFSLAQANGGPYAIVAAGGISTNDSFNVNAGGNVYSSASTNAQFNFANEEYFGSKYSGSQLITGGASPLDFVGLLSSTTTLSTELAGLNAYGAVCSVDNMGKMVAVGNCPADPVSFNQNSQHYNPSWIVLYGTNSSINVFNLTAAQLANSNVNFDLEVPTGSTVIVNVAGSSATLATGLYFQGNQVTDSNAGSILFNFPNATDVAINGQFDGTLLAPKAALRGTSQMGGVFLAASIGSTGEVHYAPFTGNLPWSNNGPSLVVNCAAVTAGVVGASFSSGALSVSGGTAPYTFSVVGTMPAGLVLNTMTGEVTGTPSSAGTFQVKATDANGVTGSSCSITISSPVSIACGALTAGEVGVAFDSGAMAASGGSAPYVYTVVGTLPAGLSLNASTGEVTGLPAAAGTFAIKVTDANGHSSTSCNITINLALSVGCAANLQATLGVAFDSGAVSVSGGTAPYAFSVVGNLPAGLSLNPATGAISGTATATGAFQVKVSDAGGATSTSCSLHAVALPLALSCASNLSATVGVVFSSGTPTVSGGVAPYTFSVVGSLPQGLSLDSSTGAVTGIAAATGSFQIKVTDADGGSTASCAITAVASPLSVACASVTAGEVGIGFQSGALSVSGGVAPYTFSVAGVLPAGLVLDSSTGAVTGTASASGIFTVKVTDANGVSSSACPITIVAAPVLSCASATLGEVGVAFNSGTLSVAGGIAPYSFSVAAGTLPAGLQIDASTGIVTGIATASGSFRVQVTDAKGATSTACPITIHAGLSVGCAAHLSATVGVAFDSGALTVSGGVGAYTYAVVGTLPAGLSLNASTGAITGTATAIGTFAVKVTDASGASNTSCAFTVVAAPLSVACASVTAGEIGLAFNSGAPTVSGGVAPYTFSVVGTLPAGLGLNVNTGAITGIATGAGSFSVKVTDSTGATGTACPISISASLSVLCPSITAGVVGLPFNSGLLSVNGGTGSLNFSVVGTLPAGLTLNASTGAVTGTPTAAGTFAIKVTDATGGVATTCNITINVPLAVACPAITSGLLGASFNSGLLSTSGGLGTYSYSVVGTLPTGLQLNAATGAVTGLPTTTGTFSIKVTDSTGASATTCPITINPPLSLLCPAVTTGNAGVPFLTTPITVIGGVAPYSYSVVGTLPAGLTLNAQTGIVSGIPTASGSFAIRVLDARGAGGPTCSFTITAGYTLTVNPSTLTVVAGHSASTMFTFTPIGGYIGTVSFACSGLPSGALCVFNPSTLIATGNNAVQSSSLTILTTASGTTTISQVNARNRETELAGFLALPSLLFLSLFAYRRRWLSTRMRGLALLLLMAAALASGVVGCGSGVLPTASRATPVGSHTVSVVATANVGAASGAATTTQTANFTLTVTQ